MGQNLFTRDDTFFGVCQGLGEDFGFNPNWLRLVFGVSLLWNPPVVLAAYGTLGLIVGASRLIAGDPRPASAGPAAAVAAVDVPGTEPLVAVAAEAPKPAADQGRVPLAA